MDDEPYVLQVAQDRSSDEKFAAQFALVLGGALLLGIVLSALIAIAVTKRGLWPLQQMTQSLERIDPNHLNERLGRTTWPRPSTPGSPITFGNPSRCHRYAREYAHGSRAAPPGGCEPSGLVDRISGESAKGGRPWAS